MMLDTRLDFYNQEGRKIESKSKFFLVIDNLLFLEHWTNLLVNESNGQIPKSKLDFVF